MKTKKQCQILHAKKRAKERFEIALNTTDYKSIISLIREDNPSVKHLYKQSNRISVKQISYNDKVVYVVYDKIRHTIVTFLLKEHVNWQLYGEAAMEPSETKQKIFEKNGKEKCSTWEELKAKCNQA